MTQQLLVTLTLSHAVLIHEFQTAVWIENTKILLNGLSPNIYAGLQVVASFNIFESSTYAHKQHSKLIISMCIKLHFYFLNLPPTYIF